MIDCPRTDAGRDEQQVHQRVHQPRGRGDEPQGREGEEDRQRGVSRPCVAVSFCFSALLLLLLLLLLLWLLPGDTLTAHDEVAKQVLHPPAGMLLVAPGVLGERRPHEGDTDGMEDGEAGRGNSTGWTGDARSELIWVVSGDSGDIGRGIAITAINLIRTNEHS